MKVEQTWTINFFTAGVFFFHCSGITYAWIAFADVESAMFVTVILLSFLMLLAVAAKRIYTKFAIPKELLVAGGFDTGEQLYGNAQSQQGEGSHLLRSR
jgi:hypothetical protein